MAKSMPGNQVSGEKFDVSEMRACKVLGQQRSTYWYIPNPLPDEDYRKMEVDSASFILDQIGREDKGKINHGEFQQELLLLSKDNRDSHGTVWGEDSSLKGILYLTLNPG